MSSHLLEDQRLELHVDLTPIMSVEMTRNGRPTPRPVSLATRGNLKHYAQYHPKLDVASLHRHIYLS